MIYLEKYENYLNEGANKTNFSGKPLVTPLQVDNFILENGGSPLKEVKDSEGSIDWIYSTIKTMSESFANSTELRIKAASILADFKSSYPNPIIEESEGSKTLDDLKELVNSILI